MQKKTLLFNDRVSLGRCHNEDKMRFLDKLSQLQIVLSGRIKLIKWNRSRWHQINCGCCITVAIHLHNWTQSIVCNFHFRHLICLYSRLIRKSTNGFVFSPSQPPSLPLFPYIIEPLVFSSVFLKIRLDSLRI